MNGIIGLTDLMLDTGLTSQQQQYQTMVKSSAHQLLDVLNDILDFSKIEAGQLSIEETEFNLRTTVECISDIVIHKIRPQQFNNQFATSNLACTRKESHAKTQRR